MLRSEMTLTKDRSFRAIVFSSREPIHEHLELCQMWNGRVCRSELLSSLWHASRGASTGTDHVPGSDHSYRDRTRPPGPRGSKSDRRSADLGESVRRGNSNRRRWPSAEEASDLPAVARRDRRRLPGSWWSCRRRLRQHPRRHERRTQPDDCGAYCHDGAVDHSRTNDDS